MAAAEQPFQTASNVFIAGFAFYFSYDFTLLVKQQCGGNQFAEFKLRKCLVGGAGPDVQTKATLGCKSVDLVLCVGSIQRDSYEAYSSGLIIVRQLLEPRHLFFARAAPRSPEVYDSGMSAQFREGVGRPIPAPEIVCIFNFCRRDGCRRERCEYSNRHTGGQHFGVHSGNSLVVGAAS